MGLLSALKNPAVRTKIKNAAQIAGAKMNPGLSAAMGMIPGIGSIKSGAGMAAGYLGFNALMSNWGAGSGPFWLALFIDICTMIFGGYTVVFFLIHGICLLFLIKM